MATLTVAVPLSPTAIGGIGDGRIAIAGPTLDRKKLSVAIVDSAEATVVAKTVAPPLSAPVSAIALAGDTLLLWTWSGDVTDDGEVVRFEAGSLNPLTTWQLAGHPLAGAVVGEQLVVADASGAIVLVGTVSGQETKRIDVGAKAVDFAKVVALAPSK